MFKELLTYLDHESWAAVGVDKKHSSIDSRKLEGFHTQLNVLMKLDGQELIKDLPNRHILSIHLHHHRYTELTNSREEQIVDGIVRWSGDLQSDLRQLIPAEWVADAGSMAISCRFPWNHLNSSAKAL